MIVGRSWWNKHTSVDCVWVRPKSSTLNVRTQLTKKEEKRKKINVNCTKNKPVLDKLRVRSPRPILLASRLTSRKSVDSSILFSLFIFSKPKNGLPVSIQQKQKNEDGQKTHTHTQLKKRRRYVLVPVTIFRPFVQHAGILHLASNSTLKAINKQNQTYPWVLHDWPNTKQ